MADNRYLYPIRHSSLSLNYRKKGQLAQLVRESDLFFRVKWQIKTVLTNVVVEHEVTASPFITSLNMLMCNVMMEILLILYTSPHTYKTVLIAKNK